MKIFILICSIVFSGCVAYSDKMRQENDLYFYAECKYANPDSDIATINSCVDLLHMRTERSVKAERMKSFREALNKMATQRREYAEKQSQIYQRALDRNKTINCNSHSMSLGMGTNTTTTCRQSAF